MSRLHGVLTAMVTPFDASGALQLAALPEFLDFQRDCGIDGVVVAGTNGEGPSLTTDERKRLLEAVLALRGGLLVVAGTGSCSVAEAIDLTRHAGEVGADAALVLPPFYFKRPPARGVADYFRRVLDASELPVIVYSIPQFSGVEVTDEILDLLKGHPRLAGIKDSAGHWGRTEALITGRRDLAVFVGSDDLLSRALPAGATGVISGTANPVPDLVVGVKRAHESGGDIGAAQARLDAAREVVQAYPFIGVSKSVLASRGVRRMWVRPPLVDLDAEQEAAVLSRLRDAVPGLLPR